MNKFTAEKADETVRLDTFVAENSEATRSYATKLILDGFVTVNGKNVAKNYKL